MTSGLQEPPTGIYNRSNGMIDNSLHAIFEEAVSFRDHLASIRANARRFHEVYDRFAHLANDRDSAIFPFGTKVLVLCEAYCGDCVLNLPLIARLVETSQGSELRVASRDEHQAVADRFPGRGGASRVPTVILLDPQWRLVGYWSERGKSDHEWMANFTRTDPLSDITLEGGMPGGAFATWLERRLAGQLPIFFERNWQDVREELRALARSIAPGPKRSSTVYSALEHGGALQDREWPR